MILRHSLKELPNLQAYLLAAVVSLLLLLTSCPSRAAKPYTPIQPDPVHESWRWESFPQLVGPGFRCTIEDAGGTLWFGVDSGVMRYDGSRWTSYTEEDGLHGAPVNILCGTREGSIYAGTRKGISRFENGRWERVFPKDTAVDWTIWSVRQMSDGSIWSATARGALCIRPDGEMLYFTTEDCAEGLRQIAPWMTYVIVPDAVAPERPWPDGVGIKLALGLPMFGGNVTKRVVRALAPGGPAEQAGVRVGDQLLVTPTFGSRVNGKAGTPVTLRVRRDLGEPFDVELMRQSIAGGFRDFWLFDVFEDRDGILWFALPSGDVIRYDLVRSDDVGTWRIYGRKDGLDIGSRTRRTKFVQTRDGVLWAVTDSEEGGVNRFDGSRWSSLRLSRLGGEDRNPSILETRDGTLWIGGHGQLHAYRDGNWTIYRSPKVGIPDGLVLLSEDSRGGLWVGGLGQGVARMNLETQYRTYSGLRYQCETPDGTGWFLDTQGRVVSTRGSWVAYGPEDGLASPVLALVVFPDGRLCAVAAVGDRAQLYAYETGMWKSLSFSPPMGGSILPPSISVLQDGALWIGSSTFITWFDGRDWGQLNISDVQSSRNPASIIRARRERPVLGAHTIGKTRDGRVWFGKGMRIYRVEGEDAVLVDEPELLTRTVTNVVVATQAGDVWAGTEFFGAFQFRNSEWTRHDDAHGLEDPRVVDLLELSDGVVMAGTSTGFTCYDGTSWYPCLAGIPPVVDDGIRVDSAGSLWLNNSAGTVRYVPDRTPPETVLDVNFKEISFPGNTAILWSGSDLWRGETTGLQYSRRLDGGPWSPYEGQMSTVLLSLHSGSHRFEVRARDSDLNVDPTPAILEFVVLPPIWRQPWMIFVVGVLVAAGVAQTVRVAFRTRSLKAANTALDAAGQDLQRRVEKRTVELTEANERLLAGMAERVQMEQELVRVERLRALGEMSAGVSHNLNNILTGVMGPAQMLKGFVPPTDVARHAEAILRCARRATELVAQLQVAVRGGADDPLVPVDLNEAVAQAIQDARPRWKDELEALGRNVEIITHLTDTPPIRGTLEGIHGILLNLIFNAVDAMPDGGRVEIVTTAADRTVELRVGDDGVGMNEDTRRRVFEPFFTTKMDVGTGLGLYTAHGTVSRWGGRIDVESKPGEGTTFHLTLPRWIAEDKAPSRSEEGPVQGTRRGRILIVDDEPIVLDVLNLFLADSHEITTFQTGGQVLASLSADAFDVALIDLGLPDRPGDLIAREVRRADPEIAIVLITGWAIPEGDPRLLPFDFQLMKPLDFEKVRSVVSEGIQLRDTRRI